MKVICKYLDKCKVLEDFHKNLCNHSHPHDKKGGCSESLCGLLGRNNIQIEVCCDSVIQYERKKKLEKLCSK